MSISIIIIFNTFMIAYSAKTYDCRNGTVYLEVNEFVFFETTNFPVLLSKEEQAQCNLMFMLSNKTTMYDCKLERNIFFPTKIEKIKNASFAILETIMLDKPFEILHETQIIHIRSTYVNNQIRKVPCFWEFISPNGYGFKIVVQKFNISRTASVKIQNTTDVIANERSLKTNFPYYNGDNYIQITLTIGDPAFIAEMEFQAVSMVNSDIIWKSKDYKIKGYENNIQCFYELVVPPKHVAIATMYGYIEDFVDYFLYHETGSNISRRIDKFINAFTEIAVDNFKGNVEKRVIFEFVSDGSVQSLGFQIVFELTYCECVKSVKCGDESFILPNQYYYCGNIKCNITIEGCPDAFTYVQFDSYTNVSVNDIFRIISNKHIVFEITDWTHDNHFTYLNSSAENIFQVITSDSTKFHVLSINVGGYEANKLKIIFTEDDMTAVIDTENSGLLIVETCDSYGTDCSLFYLDSATNKYKVCQDGKYCKITDRIKCACQNTAIDCFSTTFAVTPHSLVTSITNAMCTTSERIPVLVALIESFTEDLKKKSIKSDQQQYGDCSTQCNLNTICTAGVFCDELGSCKKTLEACNDQMKSFIKNHGCSNVLLQKKTFGNSEEVFKLWLNYVTHKKMFKFPVMSGVA